MAGQRGQASVETAVLVPAVLLLALVAWQGVLLGWAALSAEGAARAAVRAELGGEEPRAAAAASLPASMRAGMAMARSGGLVAVRVRVPAVVPWFDVDVTASAAAAGQ